MTDPNCIHAEPGETDEAERAAMRDELMPGGIEAASPPMPEASRTPSPEQEAPQSYEEHGGQEHNEPSSESDDIPVVDEASLHPTDDAASSESDLEALKDPGVPTDDQDLGAQTATTPAPLASPDRAPQATADAPNIPPLQLAEGASPDAQHDLFNAPRLRIKQRDSLEIAPTCEATDSPEPSSPESPLRPSTPEVFETSLDPTRPRTLDFRKTS